MPQFDPSTSECRIYTGRSGMLRAVGHDLELAVDSYQIDLEAAPLRVQGRFDASSLRVVGAVEAGAVRTDRLSPHDRAQIDRQIAQDVLAAARYPVIEFASTRVERDADGYRIYGRLRLHGAERAIDFAARRRAGRLEADIILHQPDFGIRPFRALGGALRVHADVRVRLRVPDLEP